MSDAGHCNDCTQCLIQCDDQGHGDASAVMSAQGGGPSIQGGASRQRPKRSAVRVGSQILLVDGSGQTGQLVKRTGNEFDRTFDVQWSTGDSSFSISITPDLADGKRYKLLPANSQQGSAARPVAVDGRRDSSPPTAGDSNGSVGSVHDFGGGLRNLFGAYPPHASSATLDDDAVHVDDVGLFWGADGVLTQAYRTHLTRVVQQAKHLHYGLHLDKDQIWHSQAYNNAQSKGQPESHPPYCWLACVRRFQQQALYLGGLSDYGRRHAFGPGQLFDAAQALDTGNDGLSWTKGNGDAKIAVKQALRGTADAKTADSELWRLGLFIARHAACALSKQRALRVVLRAASIKARGSGSSKVGRSAGGTIVIQWANRYPSKGKENQNRWSSCTQAASKTSLSDAAWLPASEAEPVGFSWSTFVHQAPGTAGDDPSSYARYQQFMLGQQQQQHLQPQPRRRKRGRRGCHTGCWVGRQNLAQAAVRPSMTGPLHICQL